MKYPPSSTKVQFGTSNVCKNRQNGLQRRLPNFNEISIIVRFGTFLTFAIINSISKAIGSQNAECSGIFKFWSAILYCVFHHISECLKHDPNFIIYTATKETFYSLAQVLFKHSINVHN